VSVSAILIRASGKGQTEVGGKDIPPERGTQRFSQQLQGGDAIVN
jgi:hypothetical protein